MAHVYRVFAAVLAYDDAATKTHLEAASALLDADADGWAINECLMFEGMARSASEQEEAAGLLERSLAMARERGDIHGIAWSSFFLGNLARDRGAYGEAAVLYRESRESFERYGGARLRRGSPRRRGDGGLARGGPRAGHVAPPGGPDAPQAVPRVGCLHLPDR